MRLRKMLSAGGHVATLTLAPASASALAIAKPKPASSATPATRARRPERSMESMRAKIAGAVAAGIVGPASHSIGTPGELLTAEAQRRGETQLSLIHISEPTRLLSIS